MGAGLSSAQKKEVEAALGRAATSKALRLTRKELKLLPEAVFTTHADLVQVDLSSNLLASLPPELGGLASLRQLYVQSNRLTALPEELGACAALQEIKAESNRLAELPDSIGKLGALRVLELRSNCLKTVPASMGRCHALRVLDLQVNELQRLPYSLGALTGLTKLELRANPECHCPPTYMHGHTCKDLIDFLAEEGGESVRRARQYTEAQRLRAASDAHQEALLKSGAAEESGMQDAAHTQAGEQHSESESFIRRAGAETAQEVAQLQEVATPPTKTDSVERWARQDEMATAEAARTAYAQQTRHEDSLLATANHVEATETLRLGSEARQQMRARERTNADADAEESAIASQAVASDLKSQQSAEGLIQRELHRDAKEISALEASAWSEMERRDRLTETEAAGEERAIAAHVIRSQQLDEHDLKLLLRAEDAREAAAAREAEAEARRQAATGARHLAAATVAGRQESLALFERHLAAAETAEQELELAAKQAETDEESRFVAATAQQRSVLLRVIRDQQAHAAAAVETAARVQAARKDEERREAVRAAVQLRMSEFESARWWSTVQLALALSTAGASATEAAMDAARLHDRRVWIEALLAERSSTETGSDHADAWEGQAAVAARRAAAAKAQLTASIFDRLLGSRPGDMAEGTAEIMLLASIHQQLAALDSGADGAGQGRLAVDAVLEPLREAAVQPISQSTTDWRQIRAAYIPWAGPQPEPQPVHVPRLPVVGVLVPAPEPEPEPSAPPAQAPQPEPEPEPIAAPPIAAPLLPEAKSGGSSVGVVLNDVTIEWPIDFVDPISLEPMTDPVRTAVGCVYDRPAITAWIERHGDLEVLDPMTNLPLPDRTLVPDDELRRKILHFRTTGECI